MPEPVRRASRGRVLSAALLVAALAACSPPPKPYASATTPPPVDPARQRAEVECAQRATRETATVSPQTTASKAAVGIYWKCMAEKGYPPPRKQQ